MGMDPVTQGFVTAMLGCLGCFLIFRFIVPLFPGDGREAERLARWERERQEREAAAKAAE
jgi:hypothetical protein